MSSFGFYSVQPNFCLANLYLKHGISLEYFMVDYIRMGLLEL